MQSACRPNRSRENRCPRYREFDRFRTSWAVRPSAPAGGSARSLSRDRPDNSARRKCNYTAGNSPRIERSQLPGCLPSRRTEYGYVKQRKEALVGVEPTVADLQSAALATWLQRLKYRAVCTLADAREAVDGGAVNAPFEMDSPFPRDQRCQILTKSRLPASPPQYAKLERRRDSTAHSGSPQLPVFG